MRPTLLTSAPRPRTRAPTVKKMLCEAGIDAPYVHVRYRGIVKHETILPKWQAASTHTARHTYGALLTKRKVDPFTMHDLLGHGNLSSTMTYVHLESEATERTVLEWLSKAGIPTQPAGELC
jgi:integrase